jgi:hypothetical protein
VNRPVSFHGCRPMLGQHPYRHLGVVATQLRYESVVGILDGNATKNFRQKAVSSREVIVRI